MDLSIALTGPYAATLLADQGAEVIKVERPGIGDIGRIARPRVGPDGPTSDDVHNCGTDIWTRS